MKSKGLLFWQVAFTYIGAVIGAGFASGQEIMRFFTRFGCWGAVGALLAGGFLAFLGYAVITRAAYYNMNSYEQYLYYLFGSKKAKVFDGLIWVFLLAGLGVMLVAGGSLFRELWGWELESGFLINAVFLYIVMLCGVKGMLWLNSLLIPGLVLLSLGVALEGLRLGEGLFISWAPAEGFIIDNWLGAALLYVSYNIVLAMVVLVALGKTARQGGCAGAIAGGAGLGIMAAVLSLALGRNAGIIEGEDLPLLALAGIQHHWLSKGYSLVLWAAIFTTALGNGLGLMKRLEALKPGPRPLYAALPFIPSMLLMGWSLSSAVAVIYPFLGYLGLILCIAILINTLRGFN